MLQPSTTIYNLLSGRASRLSGPSVLWGVCSYQVWCPRKVELCKISLQSQRSSEWISMTSGHDVDLKIYKTLKHLETTKHKKKVTPDITRLSTASERCKSMEPAKREGHEGPWNALKPSNHIKSYQDLSRSIKIYQDLSRSIKQFILCPGFWDYQLFTGGPCSGLKVSVIRANLLCTFCICFPVFPLLNADWDFAFCKMKPNTS